MEKIFLELENFNKNLEEKIEIIFNKTSFKRNNQYFYNIILK
jgi:hypothetical protein